MPRGRTRSKKGKGHTTQRPRRSPKGKASGGEGYTEEGFFHEISTDRNGLGRMGDDEEEK